MKTSSRMIVVLMSSPIIYVFLGVLLCMNNYFFNLRVPLRSPMLIKTSSQLFGTFLNAPRLSVYKYIRGGWAVLPHSTEYSQVAFPTIWLDCEWTLSNERMRRARIKYEPPVYCLSLRTAELSGRVISRSGLLNTSFNQAFWQCFLIIVQNLL